MNISEGRLDHLEERSVELTKVQAEVEMLRAVHMAADKVFVRHSVGLDTDGEWSTLSNALDVVNVAKAVCSTSKA